MFFVKVLSHREITVGEHHTFDAAFDQAYLIARQEVTVFLVDDAGEKFYVDHRGTCHHIEKESLPYSS